MELTGIHHLTAISANVRENYRFYTRALGMRLVKRSVNQDDVSAYHLFYADAVRIAGHGPHVLRLEDAARRRGTHSIVRTNLRVGSAAAVDWWAVRLEEQGVMHSGAGRPQWTPYTALRGQGRAAPRSNDDGGAGDQPVPWERSPVPAEYQIRGLGPIVLSVPQLQRTDAVLDHVITMRPVANTRCRKTPRRAVYGDGKGRPDAKLHVVVQPDLAVTSRAQASSPRRVSHAERRRVPPWTERLNEMGVPNSGEIDRYYFRSLYFRAEWNSVRDRDRWSRLRGR